MPTLNCANANKDKKLDDKDNAEFFDRCGFRILRAVRELIHIADVQSHTLKHRFQITSPQLVCLYCLNRSGPMTLSALAREVSLGPSTTTGIVDRLVAKGLVERTRGLTDHRKVDLKVTVLGRETARMAPALLQDRFTDALRQLPEVELTHITLALEQVVELMKADFAGQPRAGQPSADVSRPEPRKPLLRKNTP